MRLEQIPLLLGVLVAIIGLGLVLDAQLPDGFAPSRERRRRERTERSRPGETFVGLGILCVAAALIGRDTWRFGTVAVLLGVVLLGAGGWLNRTYLRELLVFRGAARRGEKRTDLARRARVGATQPRTVDAAAAQGSSGEGHRLAAEPGRARDTQPFRGDREAPILTANEGVSRAGSSTGDGGNADVRRPRIR